MLRRALFALSRSRLDLPARGMSSASDGKGPKDPSSKDVLGDDLLDAVNAVAKDLHGDNSEAKKTTKNTLISKLVSHEKKTFSEATASQTSDMLDDKTILNLLSDVATEKKGVQTPKSSQVRQERRGLVLLRKEIFYQAVQSGYKADEARVISEKAVEEAQQRLDAQRKTAKEGSQTDQLKEEKEVMQRQEKEKKLFDYAYQMAEKMLYQDDSGIGDKSNRKPIRPDNSLPSLLSSGKRLGVWETLEGSQSVGFWSEWDTRSARIMNQSMGPENAFEEQIEWTESGKQWPFPINNEYMLGDEEKVPFIEHVFLERHLPSLGLPKSGPIAHFMQLVCVGLSKNPYMTVSKKLEHIHWFANYFNTEKQKLVHKLHEDEQLAAQNS